MVTIVSGPLLKEVLPCDCTKLKNIRLFCLNLVIWKYFCSICRKEFEKIFLLVNCLTAIHDSIFKDLLVFQKESYTHQKHNVLENEAEFETFLVFTG